jgi:hypothetical protein
LLKICESRSSPHAGRCVCRNLQQPLPAPCAHTQCGDCSTVHSAWLSSPLTLLSLCPPSSPCWPPSMQAVLKHRFTRSCPLVQQCLEEDLQRLQDYHSGLRPSADSSVRCQQRRLVLPACAATGQQARSASTADAALPAGAATAVQGSLPSQPIRASSGSKAAQVSTSACGRATAGAAPTSQTVGVESSSLQQQGSLSSSISRGPSGWLHRSGSSGSGKPGSSWRSYRRRVTPSCKELMYVCDGDRNGVIHYIATGETRRCGVSDMPCYCTPALLEQRCCCPYKQTTQ